ncbi:MAG: exodeoxyribonuclease I [Bullifex sp.]
MTKPSIFWYDLETFGTNPQVDRIAQMAGIRTDADLNIIGEPLVLYQRPSPDYLPSIDACLLTGITPQTAMEKGVDEVEFLSAILKEFTQPDTTVTGFNSIAFDDEFIRNDLYKNLFDPYRREYTNGCSRWDVINLVRACHDLSPEGINFCHKTESGNTSFKLVHLTEDNGIEQVGAHDAMVDVYATINVTKLIKQKHPDLYSWYYRIHTKNEVKKLIDIQNHTPLLLTCVGFTSPSGCTRPVAPIFIRDNTVHAFDLTKDASALREASGDEMFRTEGMVRFALNKAPYLAPMQVLKKNGRTERLGLSMSTVERNLDIIKKDETLIRRLAEASGEFRNEAQDPELLLYDDVFTSKRDTLNLSILQNTKPADKLYKNIIFDQNKYHELLFRQMGRNWPQFLTDEQKKLWKNYCATRMLQPLATGIDYYTYMRNIDEKLSSRSVTGKDKLILLALKAYGETVYNYAFT